MITRDEAFLILRKWVEERTRLRVDGTITRGSFSLRGILRSVGAEVVTLDVDESDFIAIYLDQEMGFGYCDPDPMRIAHEDRISDDYAGKTVRYGAGVVAQRPDGARVLFIEIAGEGVL